MVCGLFSSFDPSFIQLFGYESISMKWVVSFFLIFFFCKWRVWVLVSGFDLFDKEVVKFFVSLIKQSMGKSYMNVSLMLYCVFFFFIFGNTLGLVPYVFTLSSHLCVNLSVSLVMWLSGVVFFIKNSLDRFLSHMVPLGSPVFLLPLLVLIETISMVIRPLTLSIRLMANVMAGHLIMSLLGGFSSSLGMEFVFPVLLEMGFLFFEMCVAIVQAYVFSSLMVMYLAESD